MKILADASLPDLIVAFPAPFNVQVYHTLEELKQALPGQDVLLCRSTLHVNEELVHGSSLKYVATASSGTDHVDKITLDLHQIEFLDAKGCNAIAVADYIEASIAYLTQEQLLQGRLAGIIGLGKVGAEVQHRLEQNGFEILTYDPLRASKDDSFKSCQLEELFNCDLICIHAELHSNLPYPSTHLIDADFLSNLKSQAVIINAARGGIVDEKALLDSTNPFIYCTDVYLNEPNISSAIVEKALLCTPHIAGHSLEAKHEAVAIISRKLHQIAGLPLPLLQKPVYQSRLELESLPSREEQLLTIYNPMSESLALKAATDKKASFISLRKQHHFRHNFDLYFNSLPSLAGRGWREESDEGLG